MSVWVCINRPQVAQKDTKNCDHIRADGSCSCYGMTNRKPCDAVEYAAVVKERDDLRARLADEKKSCLEFAKGVDEMAKALDYVKGIYYSGGY